MPIEQEDSVWLKANKEAQTVIKNTFVRFQNRKQKKINNNN